MVDGFVPTTSLFRFGKTLTAHPFDFSAYTVAIINFTDDDTTVDANLTEIFAYDTAAVQSTTYKVSLVV